MSIVIIVIIIIIIIIIICIYCCLFRLSQNYYSEARNPCWICGARWLIGRFGDFRPKGHGFASRSSHHVGTLDKSFTSSCLWRFGVKLRHSLSVLCRERLGIVVQLERRCINSLNERINENIENGRLL